VRLLQTIHRNISAVDPVGARRGDEHDHIRHLLGGAEAAHRKTVADVVLEVPWVGKAVAVPSVAFDQNLRRRRPNTTASSSISTRWGWIPGGDIREVLPKFRDMARDAGRDPASIEITSFALGEDLDRVKRLNELGVTRVVPMFPPEKADALLPIVDRWTKIMQQVNG